MHPTRHPNEVSHVHLTPASAADQVRGLLGYVSFELGSLHIDGVTLRRTRDGQLLLSWPAPRGYPLVRPLDERARRSIEAQVFSALGIMRARGTAGLPTSPSGLPRPAGALFPLKREVAP